MVVLALTVDCTALLDDRSSFASTIDWWHNDRSMTFTRG